MCLWISIKPTSTMWKKKQGRRLLIHSGLVRNYYLCIWSCSSSRTVRSLSRQQLKKWFSVCRYIRSHDRSKCIAHPCINFLCHQQSILQETSNKNDSCPIMSFSKTHTHFPYLCTRWQENNTPYLKCILNANLSSARPDDSTLKLRDVYHLEIAWFISAAIQRLDIQNGSQILCLFFLSLFNSFTNKMELT